MITTGSADSKTKKWMMNHIGWSLQLQRVECKTVCLVDRMIDAMWLVLGPKSKIVSGITCWKYLMIKIIYLHLWTAHTKRYTIK